MDKTEKVGSCWTICSVILYLMLWRIVVVKYTFSFYVRLLVDKAVGVNIILSSFVFRIIYLPIIFNLCSVRNLETNVLFNYEICYEFLLLNVNIFLITFNNLFCALTGFFKSICRSFFILNSLIHSVLIYKYFIRHQKSCYICCWQRSLSCVFFFL